MRVLMLVIVLCPVVNIADACPWEPRTYVHASRGGRAPLELMSVPPRPSFFAHVSADEFPRFTTQGGEPIPFTETALGDSTYRFDLDIADGIVRIAYANREDSHLFVIDRSLRPATTSVDVTTEGDWNTFAIDSSASAFRIGFAGGRTVIVFNSDVPFELQHAMRITALYANRREEVIYERHPVTVARTTLLLGILLTATLLLAWFVTRGPASGRASLSHPRA